MYIKIKYVNTNNGDIMKENINALDELNKGTTMGMEAIEQIKDKIGSDRFKKVIEKQYEDYKMINERIEELYNEYNNRKEPHEISAMTKMMTWYDLNVKMMMDDSDSKIAELLLKGTNMGIIEGKKIYNNKKLDKKVVKIVDDYIVMQEKIVEDLKDFL